MNLKDFSRLLGLSPTTVSRALNGYPVLAFNGTLHPELTDIIPQAK